MLPCADPPGFGDIGSMTVIMPSASPAWLGPGYELLLNLLCVSNGRVVRGWVVPGVFRRPSSAAVLDLAVGHVLVEPDLAGQPEHLLGEDVLLDLVSSARDGLCGH